jgi:parvulin-like peptidyl-prolyl isomerase
MLLASMPLRADDALPNPPVPTTQGTTAKPGQVAVPAPPAPPTPGTVPSTNQPKLTPPPAPAFTQERTITPPSAKELAAPGIHAKLPETIKVTGIAAKVGNASITNEDLVKSFLKNGGAPLLGQLITASMVDQEAKKEGVVVAPAEVKDRLKDIKTQILSRGQNLTWAQYLTQAGVSEDMAVEQTRLNLEVEKLVQKTIPPVNMSDQYHLRHILIITNKDADPAAHSDADALKQINEIADEIKSNKITFENAAKKYSEDRSNNLSGGDLGWVDKNTTALDKTFATAAFELKQSGQVSAPVKSRFGYHLIYLEKLGDQATPAEVASVNKQHRQVSRQDIGAYFTSLKAKYHVSNLLMPGVPLPSDNLTVRPIIMNGNPNMKSIPVPKTNK